MKNLKPHRPRSGFTLLELLMVIALIGVLASLSVVVFINITDQANEEATAATLRKLNGLLEKRIEGFNKVMSRNGSFKDKYIAAARNLLIQDQIYGPLIANRDNGEQDTAVIEALARKVAMRHLFPQRHEDLLLLDFLSDGKTSVTDFSSDTALKNIPSNPSAPNRTTERSVDTNGNRIADRVEATATDQSLLPTADTWVQDATVSAELLYFFLINSEGLGASEAIGDQFTTSEIADTDNDGLLEFVDAWGNPLRFYRWPTRIVDINPPTLFQPELSNLSDATDVLMTIDHDNDATTPEVTVGTRVINSNERIVANTLLKGLPPAPTNLPNGAVPRDLLLIDPDDPVGVLYRALEEYDGARDINGNGSIDPGEQSTPLRVEFNETNYHTPDTYHVPLIVSAGADEQLGMFEPSDTANLGNLAAYDLDLNENGTPEENADITILIDRISDNLTNRNKRAGGR